MRIFWDTLFEDALAMKLCSWFFFFMYDSGEWEWGIKWNSSHDFKNNVKPKRPKVL